MLTPPYTPRSSIHLSDSDAGPSHTKLDPSTPARLPTHAMFPSNLLTPPATPPDSPELAHEVAKLTVAPVPGPSVGADYGAPARVTQERRLTDNELSYYLPARGEGVNDMYLHHRFTCPAHKASFDRVLHIWALQLLRHPLLAGTISSAGSSDYTDVRFVHARPVNYVDALREASTRFDFERSSRSVVDAYLNGDRSLSDHMLSKLVLVAPALYTPPASPGRESARYAQEAQDRGMYELMLCATHFIGDGMALHTTMNEFYTLLGSDKTVRELEGMLRQELSREAAVEIPKGLEACLPRQNKLQAAAGQVAYDQAERRLVGGQSFPGPVLRRERRTVVPTFAYSTEDTKKILGKCKANGVTIAHAIFALCNIAWTRVNGASADPCMMYSALNLRPNMARELANESFFHLAVGYFNIILPSLLPPTIDAASLLWHRARETKAQTMKAVKSPFLVSKSKETMRIRRERAVRWAGIDDGVTKMSDHFPTKRSAIVTPELGVSQKAFMGVSMLGNLDGMYKHAEFPDVELKSLMTGSRQRPGGLLLFAYTFQSQLWLSLGYDINGFKEGSIEAFWSELQMLVGEVML